jgi:hypothetical protein
MRKWQGAALLLAMVLLFLVANRGAYQGYFIDDDLDNISWTSPGPWWTFLSGIADFRYYPQNYRPVGHLAYHVLANTAGLEYRWYVALIHIVHFANTVLIWLLLRRLGVPVLGACAGALFFVFHMSLFDVLWKPMFQFDAWCALFSLLSLHSWISRRWVFSFVFFWLAYKSKEHAVMLPAALAVYEWWLGEKRWRPLLPFFAASFSFGVQGILRNRETGSDYSLQFSALTLVRTFVYYAMRILLVPYLGFLLLLLPRRVPDRRLWFGLAFCGLLLLPMLALPNRVSPAYLYAPLAGVAVATGILASRFHWGFTLAFFVLWLPLNFQSMRSQRRAALTHAHENRAYIEALEQIPSKHPGIRRFIYDGHPPQLRWWGIRGALRILYRVPDIEMISIEEKNLHEAFASGPVALLSWDPAFRKLSIAARAPGAPDASYMTMSAEMPIWQFEDGWYPREGHYRWTKPVARVRLWRPADATHFEVKVLVGPQLIELIHRTRLEVRIDEQPAGSVEFVDHGWRTVRFPLSRAPAAPVRVEFRATPFRPSPTDRELGLALGGFGFVTDGTAP